MSGLVLGVLGIVLLLILLFSGMNIGFSMLVVGFLGMIVATSWSGSLGLLMTIPYAAVAKYSLSVIPLFVLMGQFAYWGGLSQDMYVFCYRWLGRLPGGLAVATIGACGGFSAICGSSTATAATMGTVCLPEMKKYGYASGLSTGSVAAGGTLGILLPPSVGFILYGVTAEVSIGHLFAAGLIPGIMLMIFYMLTVVVLVLRKPEIGPKSEVFTLREKMAAFKGVIAILILFVIVVGGIFIGIFTANEGASVGAFGAFLFLVFKRRKDPIKETFKKIVSALADTIRTSCMIFLIMIGAEVFGKFLAFSGLPSIMAKSILSLHVNAYVVLALILLIYMLLGFIMDSLGMVLLLVPIFLPVVTGLGIDLVWFGVLMVMVMETGLMTPPVGMNVFVIKGIAKDVPLFTIFRGVFPFVIALVLAIIVVILIPQLALWFPSIVM